MADALDSKSSGKPCRFKSGQRQWRDFSSEKSRNVLATSPPRGGLLSAFRQISFEPQVRTKPSGGFFLQKNPGTFCNKPPSLGLVVCLQADFVRTSSSNETQWRVFSSEKSRNVFATGKLSITYLVDDGDTGEILGYFTLTHKSIVINGYNLSVTSKKKLPIYSRIDASTGNYMASSFLLAQFGKNHAPARKDRIDGAELMELATSVLVNIHRQSRKHIDNTSVNKV